MNAGEVVSSGGWTNSHGIRSFTYDCGYCGENISSNLGYEFNGRTKVTIQGHEQTQRARLHIHICHCCGYPTFFSRTNEQTPGAPFGEKVEHLPEMIGRLYQEARECTRIKAYTAAVMCCRKILMNFAVHEGAEEGKNWKFYVNYLNSEGYVPSGAKAAVAKIREVGNTANHEIEPSEPEEAEQLLYFLGVILKSQYEVAERLKIKNPPEETS